MIRSFIVANIRRPAIGVCLAFLTLNILLGGWIARIPEIKARLGLGEAALGLCLLGMSIGAFCSTPVSARLMSRLSAGRASLISTLLFCATAVLPGFATGQYSLMFFLFLVGLTNGFMNVSINAAAASLEDQQGISIMSTCHGMFSLGGMLGAGIAGWMAASYISLQTHLIVLALLMILINLAFRPALETISGREEKQAGASFHFPKGALLGLAFIGFCVMVGEGAVADWSAVYLHEQLHARPALAALGYAGFSLAMALGRFSGDPIRGKFGSRKVVQFGVALGLAGLLLAITAENAFLAIAGFTFVGIGFSSVVPVLFSAAARTPGVSPGAGIATIASAGISGFLIAPPVIGFIAEHSSLGVGLGFVAFLAFCAILATKVVRF